MHRQDGRIYAWGCAEDGRLGLGDMSNPIVPKPTQVLTPSVDVKFVSISAGSSHNAAVTGKL